MNRLAAISSIALACAYPWSPDVTEVVQSDYSAQYPSHFFGKDFETAVTSEALKKTPDWHDEQENPPVSARKAMKLATGVKDSLLKDSSTKWKLIGLCLDAQFEKKWVWLVSFSPEPQVTDADQPPTDLITVVVLMDGTVLGPTEVQNSN
jgi:hypothetical protein